MIDFKGLDKTQMRYVERDCPDIDMLHRICFNKVIDVNPILNNVISDVIMEILDLHPILKYSFNENDDILYKIQNVIEFYQFRFMLLDDKTIPNIISNFMLKNRFNNKAHRALLLNIFGDKVHEEDFMANLQFVISRILYAILYV